VVHSPVDEIRLRTARSVDGDLLADMLGVVAAWRPGYPTPGRAELLVHPGFAHYVDGWPRTGDGGIVAESGSPIGATWFRCFTAEDPGYGFVAPEVPEVSIGVVAFWRGRGIGRMLLEALNDRGREAGHERLSLSVEPDNPAVELYRSVGFARVGGTGGADTMVIRL
jgi:GNAT superfamily N-acetyltransferase